MKRISKYFLLFILLVCMAFAGTACGKKNTNTLDKNTVYKEAPISIELPQQGSLQNIFVIGDKLVFCGYSYDENYANKYYFTTCNPDGSDRVTKYLDNIEGNAWLQKTLVTEDNKFLCLFSCYSERWENDEYFYENHYELKIYDSNLNLLRNVSLADILDSDWINGFYAVKGGKILLDNGVKYILLDENFKVVKTKEYSNQNISEMYNLKDGRSIVWYWSETGMTYSYFNPETLEFGDTIEFPFNINNYSILNSTNYDLILCDNAQMYGYNIGDSSLTPLMNFINSDLYNNSFSQIAELKDGSFVGAYYDWYSDDYSTKVCRYTKVAPEDVIDKQIITLGCLYLTYDLRTQIIDFNKSSDEYRITYTDYSVYNTEDNYLAGNEKLNSDIASGNGPDIIIASDTSTIANYMSKGLFVDLYKYMDADEEINREDIFPNLLEACSYNGKLYTIVPYFYVNTVAAKTSVLNGKTSWNMQEMMNFEKTLPEGSALFYNMTRSEFLSSVIEVNGNYFVNTATGKCNFNSPEFIQILEYCKTLPEDIDYGDDDYILYDKMISWDEDDWATRYRSNRAVLDAMTLSGFYDYKYALKGTFGEDITFIGYPTVEGSGSAISFSFALAITSKCANPEGAWQFIRHFLTMEYQNKQEYSIPASMKAFDELGEKQKIRRSYEWDGETYYDDDYYWIGGESVVMELLNDADIAKFKNYILTTTTLRGSIEEVLTIIDEEAQAFFAGQKSASDVANIIQSRSTIYISEKQ